EVDVVSRLQNGGLHAAVLAEGLGRLRRQHKGADGRCWRLPVLGMRCRAHPDHAGYGDGRGDVAMHGEPPTDWAASLALRHGGAVTWGTVGIAFACKKTFDRGTAIVAADRLGSRCHSAVRDCHAAGDHASSR